ncbi:MAG: CPBP family intramembrane metalloprotease [Phenylobacterium sp.]|uniref:CPBP family intramembrane glutamic endopeptidase n=1 Tax=Phenylobacterium sp. TaxID=1871053 RepID=UPI001A41D6E6|nr:CPBP family intramembrane glutamic endopeptidase [Phenylobacterium sp.]MBL8770022.1 CPBP family intramembrane metalloprotease [Phenylobacterium sp.]
MTAADQGPQARIVPFFLLTTGLTLPFWALGAWVQFEPLPGLPASSLMAFCPAAAALILAARAGGGRATRALAARSFDVARLRGRWPWLAVTLLMPALAGAAWLLQRQAGLLGEPQPGAMIAPLMMLAVFFVAALGEELGWSGYILEPMRERWGETAAALAIGIFWAAWHILPFLQADRAPEWIAWQCAKTVAVRVVMVRLYFGAGRSVFAVALFHALSNVAAFWLPFVGAQYDARLGALTMIPAAIALTLANRR